MRALRDEIVDLGPYAFQELTFATAIENCMPVWQRRLRVRGSARHRAHRPSPGDGRRPVPDRAGGGRERWAARQREGGSSSRSGRSAPRSSCAWPTTAAASTATGPLAPSEPGHLGLASMRERAELMDGALEIETSSAARRVLVRAPLRAGARRSRSSRARWRSGPPARGPPRRASRTCCGGACEPCSWRSSSSCAICL